MIAQIAGTKIFVDQNATEHDGYNFKFSKNRSARVYKKLIKRFGCYERRKPAAYQIKGLGLFMHPEIFAKMKEEIEGRSK